MRDKKPCTIVGPNPNRSFVLVHADGHEESVGSKHDGAFVLVRADGRQESYAPAASNLVQTDAATDESIARQTASDPEFAPVGTDEMFAKAEIRIDRKVVARRSPGRPKSAAPKKTVALRLDQDVIEGFRAGGAGWQSRMNAVLRAHLVRPRGLGPGDKGRKKVG